VTRDVALRFRTHWYGEVASTNDIVAERARAGDPEGLVVAAQRQTRGRGRHGRAWHSPEGNLYASFLLRSRRSLEKAASLSLVVALTLAETIEARAGGRLAPRLKWPNDVLIDGAKVAGILLESAAADTGAGGRSTARGDAEGSVIIVGVGVNLRHGPFTAAYPVTTLAAEGLELAPADLLEPFLDRLAPAVGRWRREGFAAFREAWLARAHGLGRKGGLRIGREERQGSFVAIDADGAIVLETAAGEHVRMSAGELFFSAD